LAPARRSGRTSQKRSTDRHEEMAFRLPRFPRRPRRILRVLELRKPDSASERQAPDEKQCLPRCRAGLFSFRGKLLRGVKSARRACGGETVHGQDRGQRVPSVPLFPRGRSLLSPRCVVDMSIAQHSSSQPGRRPCFQASKRPGTAFRGGQAAHGRLTTRVRARSRRSVVRIKPLRGQHLVFWREPQRQELR
jgi:hypothetical protein